MSTFTVAQLAAMKAQYARGVLRVTTPDGTTVQYESLDALGRAISQVEAELVNAGLLTPPGGPALRYGVWDRC
ncbi:phage head-tail joining protein [Falsiroseomonas selenitidurans]|uniref:Phage tail protein n=1 Tax=Falsiroseomonas selenitidurans TaxID=2716335 RepID=A0ABX1E8X6_9PROT|nr:hypothetical protein [Falsiroseomonas selenitidurans]NKC33491.1 hypothetical protein [Falsiroseomonas selenitidurans]